MGFFNKILGKEDNIEFLLPLGGEVIDISDVPDPVFSQKMMGDGFAINPDGEGKVFSPVSGEIASIFPTNHALGIKTEQGIEVLIHVGLDTVNLKGEGFTAHVKAGDKVKAGDLLLDVDFERIKDKVPSIITPVVFTAIEGHSFTVTKGSYTSKTDGIIKINKG